MAVQVEDKGVHDGTFVACERRHIIDSSFLVPFHPHRNACYPRLHARALTLPIHEKKQQP